MFQQNKLKIEVAKAAVEEILTKMPKGIVLGIGTGSTVNFFIDAIANHASYFSGVISSSDVSTKKLIEKGFRILDCNQIMRLPLYVDSADEIDKHGNMLKGGGGALTREKILAQLAKLFICIVDNSKEVEHLGAFPLPIEVIPMASNLVKMILENLGAIVTLRKKKNAPFLTDNNAWILDVTKLSITDPVKIEEQINHIPGVISNGLFAKRKADLWLISQKEGIKKYQSSCVTMLSSFS